MTKILLICHDIPSMTVGATLPIYHLIKNLGRKYEITLISFDSKKHHIEEIEDYLADHLSLDIPEYLDISSQLKYTVKNMLSIDNIRTRSILNYYYHPQMKRLIDKHYDDADVIITDMPMAFYVKNSSLPKIVYAFDAVSDYNHRMYLKSESITSKMYWYMNYLKIHNYEKVYNNFDSCILVNRKDKNILEKDIHIPLSVVPNGVDTEFFKNESVDDEVKLVFLGDMSTPPNNDAVKHFVDKIYNHVLDKRNVDFYIVGRNPSAYVKSLEAHPHITVTGAVDDVRSYLGRGTIFITPMISGTGIKNKILEAMSMNLAVVSTSTGISGISAEDNVEFLLADSDEDFADRIISLVDDKSLRENIGDNARVFVENNYSWSNSMDKIEEIIDRIIT